MEERTVGLILRTYPLTETSLIAHWLTRDHGRVSTAAKGARRPKSSFAGKLDLFFLGEITFRRSRKGDLHALMEVRVLDFHPTLREDLARLERASYFARLLQGTTETDTPLPGLLELTLEALAAIAGPQASTLHVLAFELKLLQELGLCPELEKTSLSQGARQVMRQLTESGWSMADRLRVEARQEAEIQAFLGNFLLHQFGRKPFGRAELFPSHRGS